MFIVLIPHLICWTGLFLVGRSSEGYVKGAIEAAIVVLPSGTPLTISRPMCSILSSRVSYSAVLMVPHICCGHHLLPTPSSHTNFSFCLRLRHRHSTPPPRFGRKCKRICVEPRPPSEAKTTKTAYPAASDLSTNHSASKDASIITTDIRG